MRERPEKVTLKPERGKPRADDSISATVGFPFFMSFIQLIRHGESIANAGGVSKSPSCIPLSVLGEKQAIDLLQHIPQAPDLIVISSYIRTHQTAAPLRARFPEARVETWPVHEFTYLSAAQYADTTEILRTPAAQIYWQRQDPVFCEGPGAESFADFIGRVDALRIQLSSRPEQHIYIFTHSFFINAIQWRALQPETELNAEAIRSYQEFRRENEVPHARPILYPNTMN
jgi:probable phosphoglycerate mutase